MNQERKERKHCLQAGVASLLFFFIFIPFFFLLIQQTDGWVEGLCVWYSFLYQLAGGFRLDSRRLVGAFAFERWRWGWFPDHMHA
jgi:hypothetical protein